MFGVANSAHFTGFGSGHLHCSGTIDPAAIACRRPVRSLGRRSSSRLSMARPLRLPGSRGDINASQPSRRAPGASHNTTAAGNPADGGRCRADVGCRAAIRCGDREGDAGQRAREPGRGSGGAIRCDRSKCFGSRSSTLRPGSPAGAEPAKRSVSITFSQTEIAVRPGSSQQSSSKGVAASAIAASQSGSAALPVTRGQLVAAGSLVTIPTSAVAGVDEPADGRQRLSMGSGLTETGPESGVASAPLDEASSVTARSGHSAEAERVLGPGPQPSIEASQKAPQEDQAAAREPESAATGSTVEDAARAIAKTTDSEHSRTSPRNPIGQAESADPLAGVQASPSVELPTACPVQGSPTAASPVDPGPSPAPGTLDGAAPEPNEPGSPDPSPLAPTASRAPRPVASSTLSSARRPSSAVTGVHAPDTQAQAVAIAIPIAAPGMVQSTSQSVGSPDTAQTAQAASPAQHQAATVPASSEPQQPEPPDVPVQTAAVADPTAATSMAGSLTDSARASLPTSPTQSMTATIPSPSGPESVAPRALASQDLIQPAPGPPTETAAPPTNMADATATGASAAEYSALPQAQRIDRSAAATSGVRVQQDWPSPSPSPSPPSRQRLPRRGRPRPNRQPGCRCRPSPISSPTRARCPSTRPGKRQRHRPITTRSAPQRLDHSQPDPKLWRRRHRQATPPPITR